jgi:LysR family transcriptional regulator, transcriptional activator of nhaA
MGWLNYHHFFYFWTVTREGSIARAARALRLTEPTVSSQIHDLEKALGEPLFRREGRGLVLTDAGLIARRYANHIFTLGQEFQAAFAGAARTKEARFRVGITEVIPRQLAFRLLEPVLRKATPYILSCESAEPGALLVKLVTHQVDAVLCEAPIDPQGSTATFHRLLGECGVSVFGTAAMSAKLRRGFPKSLDGVPFLLPAGDTAMRRSLERWFLMIGVRPQLRGEFTDGALLKTFGSAGIGAFAAPTAIEREVRQRYQVRVIGRIPTIRAQLYVVSASRKSEHPAIALISDGVSSRLFG